MRTRQRIKAECSNDNIDRRQTPPLTSSMFIEDGSKPNAKYDQNATTNVITSVKEEPTIDASPNTFEFLGIHHNSYEDMVKAKRQRNAQILIDSGLLEASTNLRHKLSPPKSTATQRGLKRADTNRKRKESSLELLPRRKSGRIRGVKSAGLYIAEERSGGRFTVGVENGADATLLSEGQMNGHTVVLESAEDEQYRNRINNGDDLTLQEAIESSGSKWVKDDSVVNAEHFVRDTVTSTIQNRTSSEHCTTSSLHSQISSLSVDNVTSVAKVVPERIYAVAFHPSPHKIISVAGDKKGHVGFWDIDATSTQDDSVVASSAGITSNTEGVHLFKPHSGAVANLEWNRDGTKLFSVSYDSTVRMFDMEKQSFTEMFAAYDDSPEYKGKPGFGIDLGYKFWTQYGCLDHRNDDSMFLTTSMGSVLHLDFRGKRSITMNHKVSEKKVNTVSLHPNGTTVATCGLDCQVKLWDLRKFGAGKASTVPFATQRSARSINSAFFSPTGKHLLNTHMTDSLDIITDAHLKTKLITKPTRSIRHDNRTGRWLSTFMARWHPTAHDVEDELFVVGSMQRPRTMELFNSTGQLSRGLQGDALTAVVSRCCFHPSLGSLVVMGGNSSGRVTVAR